MAISVSEILGQDSPNSGRLKVNTNFDTIVSEVNSHGGLLGSLVGGVVDLNSGQTLTNKTLVSNNWDGTTEHGAGSNIITIGHYDIYDNYFSFTNHYPGISIGNQHTTYVNKTTTYNNVNISGFGGFTPEIDTPTSTLSFGFPETAKLNHPDGGTQSLVINADTKLGAAVLDVNGSSTFRSKLEIGDAADGGYDHDVHITNGSGGTSDTIIAVESNSTSGTNKLMFRRNYNSGVTLDGKYLGKITFRGTYGSSGTNFSGANTSTRIQAQATEDHNDVNSQGSKLEFWTVPNSATSGTAVKVMTIDENSNLGIGKANTEAKLHVQATSGGAGGSSGVHADADEAMFEGDDNTGITIKSPNNKQAMLMFADQDTNNQFALSYVHSNDTLVFAQTGSIKLTMNSNTGHIGIGSTVPTEAMEAIGTAGSPLKMKADVHIVATQLTSHPADPAAFYIKDDAKPYLSSTGTLNFRNHTQNHTIVTMDAGSGPHGFVGINKTDPDIPLHVVQNDNTARKGLRVEGASGGDIDLYMTDATGVVDISNPGVEIRPGTLDDAFSITKVDTEYNAWPADTSLDGLNDDTLQRLHANVSQSGTGKTPGAQARVGINLDTATMRDLHDDNPYTLALGGAGTQYWDLGEGMSFTSQGNYYGAHADARLLTLHDSGTNAWSDGGFSIQSMSYGTGTAQFSPIAHFRARGTDDLARIGIGTKRVPAYSLDTDGSINADGNVIVGGTITAAGSITTNDTLIVNGANDIVINDISIDILDSQNPTDGSAFRRGYTIEGERGTYDAAATVIYQTDYVHSASDKKPILYTGFMLNSTEEEGGIYLAGTSAVRLPKGNFSQQPGESNWVDPEVGMMRYTTATHNGHYPGGYYECYQRTNSSNHEWVHIATPPIGTGYMQWHGMDEPMDMYPNTTWELGSMPEDVFIRNEGQDQNNADNFGAKPFNGNVQKQNLVQHEHKIHRPHGDEGTQWERCHNGDSDPLHYRQHHDFSTGAYLTGSDMDGWYSENTNIGKENRPLNVTVRFWKRTA